MYLYRPDARKLLPQVGELRREIPVTEKETEGRKIRQARDCEVVYVNRAHLWYMVQFYNGTRECYKIPGAEAEL